MPEAHTGSVVAPIFQTSTFMMDTPGETRAGFDYARTGTPNRSDLEQALCELEGASFAAAVSSGTSAEVAVFSSLLRPGDEVILPRDVYGGTFRLLQNEYVRWGVVIRTVDLTDTAALAAAINDNTAIIWVETPSNPGLDIIDIAQAVAEWLETRDEVAEVIYPGLPSHPGHEVAKRQMSGFGGVVSLRTDTEERALSLVANTKLITLAESLGGVESLIDHPATMTHLSVAGSEVSVSGRFIRLSVGIEDVEDILADLAQALDATSGAAGTSPADGAAHTAPAGKHHVSSRAAAVPV